MPRSRKKTRKTARKASRRSARKVTRKTGRRRSGASLASVPMASIVAELQRRANALSGRRAELESELQAIDAELGAIAGATAPVRRTPGRTNASASRAKNRRQARKPARSRTARKRPRNEMSLEDALAKLLKGKTMGVAEMVDAVQKAGYKTNSPNFRVIVNATLLKSPKFKRVARGQYTAK